MTKRQNGQTHRRKLNSSRKEKTGKLEQETSAVESGQDFAIGFYGVSEALQAKRGNKLFVQEDIKGRRIDEVKQLAQEFSVPVQFVPKSKLDHMTDRGNHQGVVLGVTPFSYLSVEELLNATTSETPFFLILDGIEDPHNFGSILRTADAVGVDGVIIPKHRAVGITSIVSKTSTGAVEHIPVARATNLSQAIRQLKERNFWIFGTDMTGTDYRNWNVSGAVALIIGNEGKGISPGLKKEIDEMLTIPMTGHVQSLNASVAAGIMMYEVFRKRQE
ncbi:23S rRNA (guanosine(2251)-2'-O)-methyltransferase RlmB [Vagococcus elongatus]|uniref:23S rRNA (Guanosine(2251)-2'-O)-methyltransferase RlmB n=1 Tax=Vagococcus elongatus TaxID=180344 RepID=A0A430B190_9ENTE|nr:23S rRNA (guanosine(2251)-2'-O)-methyltransferase RlmB [Vagococcus elongatus]RSU14078.1 23S rRNA (guanosine(2251)-2'-O)-methyltransferase RlmB [Vagococcus elongatus]